MSAVKPIFCLICDRAPGYFEMTIQAIKCVKKHTKTVAIGVIFPPGSGDLTENSNAVYTSLKKLDSKLDQSNIFFKEGTNHFENWNPTQHKLDIQLFANTYDPVVWLDSDTVVLKDLVPFIKSFVSTNKKIALLSDHVNNDENFRKNWEGPVFIPQACYMIFRSAYISSFFKIWEDTWREWITPYPFAVHKDPAPHFNNSFFCIEQYALGQSLFKFTQNFEKDIEIIDRSQLFIGRNVAVETQKIKQLFQQKSASRPSIDAFAKSPLIEKNQNPPPRTPKSVPLETGSSSASSIPWGGATPVSTTYAAEAIGAEGGFLVTATYTATPGVFQESIEPTTSSTSFSAAESDLSVVTDTLNALNIKPVSLTPSSYVTSYGVYPSSYASSYGGVTSYGAGVTVGGVTSYGAAVGGVTSYGAAVGGVTSYGAAVGGVTSYGAAVTAVGGITSYGAAVGGVTSYGAAVTGVGGVTSYGAAVTGVGGVTSYGAGGGAVTSYSAGGGGVGVTSYGAVTSYGGGSYPSSYASSSGLSSAGLSSVHLDGGIPLTNYGNLSFQFSIPSTPDAPTAQDSEATKASVFVYGSADANVYFLSTNATLTSSAQTQNNLSNSNNEYYMVDLIQDNSIAHYYNANQGTNSDFVASHGSAVADTITQIKTQTSSKGKKGTKGGK